MKVNSTSAELLLIGTLLLPFIYLGLIWNQLPTEVATHYDLTGHPNGWMRKDTAALVLAVSSLVLYLVLRFLPNIDPKSRLQSANYGKLRFIITLAFAAIMGWMWYMAVHQADNQKLLVFLFVILGLLVAGMGNYMTTVKPNWFVGIRTPWTLESETVWRRTHQLGGRLMVAGGLLSAVLALVVPMSYTVTIAVGIIVASALIPTVYSYIYFRQEKAHQLN